MTTRKRAQALFLATALFVASGLVGVYGQQPAPANAAPPPPLTQAMPVDPAITQGQLPNGLRYYVRANKKPEKRAELRLVVNAGSILEDDDQRGLAHFVEHMAFNGTEHFPKQQVVSFLESLGMRFGADVNAYTSFDETVFMLTVPTDKPETMDKSLLILEDWAHGVSFEPAEVEKERGVVMEEWRLRRGANARMQDKVFPVWLAGSRYPDRLPIGTTEIIQGFKPERLKKFYADWYRPDLMAVVAVGDFDKAAVESLIKTHFGAMAAPAAPRPRATFDIPDRPATVFAITADKEQPMTTVEIETLLPARPEGTVGGYRQKTVDRLFSSMLSARFAEIAQKPDAPFLQAFTGRGPFLARSKENATLAALVKEDSIERGLEALVSEAERVTRYGFTATELERQKVNVLRGYERNMAERENRVSASRADEYVRNFLQKESLPSAEDEYSLHQRLLPTITLDEINKLAREWFPDNNRIVIVTAPDKPGLVLPDEAKLKKVLRDAEEKELKAYVDTAASATLLDAVPAGGTIARTTAKDAIGITEWDLSNGVKVVLKPTTFKEDEILFTATSPGGTSLASDQDYIPASTATQLVTAGGVGKLNAIDYRKVMTGKIASANPYISELAEGMSGSSSRKDLETMFQLIYLRFTQPRADAAAVAAQASQMKTMLANQMSNPSFVFVDAINSAMYQNHPRRRTQTAATVDEWNLDKSLAFYKDRFADASDFTFVIVGSFDLPTIKPLVERYLGGLPSTRRKETWKDVGAKTATGVIDKTVEKGIEPKSQAAIVFTGPFEWNQTQRIAIRAMAEILQTRLLELIREDLGGTYSITAGAGYSKLPTPDYSIRIQFGSDPTRNQDLVGRVLKEIEDFKASGPTEKQLNDEKQALMRDFEANTKQNGYYTQQISLKYQYGEDPATLWDIPDYYKKLDAATIQQAAKTYLNSANRIKVTLMPEKK
jgi:zinc protease